LYDSHTPLIRSSFARGCRSLSAPGLDGEAACT
jgi:hypothetical protein